ncbi:hypothetical protein BC829DRAFT_438779 [Chytridium lagenaria]|nr:hypothetical protein BC829DRAFT_438779 [Chytridium lagenaria]
MHHHHHHHHHLWHWGNTAQSFPLPASTLAIAWEGRVSLSSHRWQRRASAATASTTSRNSLMGNTELKTTNNSNHSPPPSPCPSPTSVRKRRSGILPLNTNVSAATSSPSSLSAPAMLSKPPLPSETIVKSAPLAPPSSAVGLSSVKEDLAGFSGSTTAVGTASVALKSPCSTVGSMAELSNADNATLLGEIARLKKLVDRTVRRAEDAEIRINILEGERQGLDKDLKREKRRSEELLALCTEQAILLGRPKPWGSFRSVVNVPTSSFFNSVASRPMHTLASHPTTSRHIQMRPASAEPSQTAATPDATVESKSVRRMASTPIISVAPVLRDSPAITLTPFLLSTRIGSWAFDQAKIASSGSWLPANLSSPPSPPSPSSRRDASYGDGEISPPSLLRSRSFSNAGAYAKPPFPASPLRSRASDANIMLSSTQTASPPRSPGATLRRVKSVDPSLHPLRQTPDPFSLPPHPEEPVSTLLENKGGSAGNASFAGSTPLSPPDLLRSASSPVAGNRSGLLDGIALSPSIASFIKPPRGYGSKN